MEDIEQYGAIGILRVGASLSVASVKRERERERERVD